jgi:acid phosphatase family membrane protein YuiD
MAPPDPRLIFKNEILMITLVSWGVAQLVKPFTHWLIHREWDWSQLFSAGGMPSSHTTLVVSATLASALILGFDSPLFAVAAAFSMVVIYDAAGVRREAGFHAQALNAIMQEMRAGHPVEAQTHFREVLGHTPLEVLGGILWATVATSLLWRLWR